MFQSFIYVYDARRRYDEKATIYLESVSEKEKSFHKLVAIIHWKQANVSSVVVVFKCWYIYIYVFRIQTDEEKLLGKEEKEEEEAAAAGVRLAEDVWEKKAKGEERKGDRRAQKRKR